MFQTLPKDIFPSLLQKLMVRLKPSNLASGFKAAGIYPLHAHQVLKRLPNGSGGDDSINESIINDAALNVLKENCGIEFQRNKYKPKEERRYRHTCSVF